MKKRRKWKIAGIVLLVVLLLLAGAGVGAAALNEYTLVMDVPEEQELTLSYGEVYTPPEAVALCRGSIFHRNGEQVPVQVEGQVNTDKVGDYAVTYTAAHRGLTDSQTHIIHVVDEVAPVITLVETPGSYTLPGQEYVEEGFTATDEYDGDLTAQVERTVTEKQIVYRVTDSSGNSAEATRVIHYDDPIAPELHLEGEAEVSVPLGGTYEEPGFSAWDNCDGDLTGKVSVSGQVDTNKLGTVTIEYSVADSYGNIATAAREVTIVPPRDPNRDKDKVIYLTFDDGPSANTARLLDVLAKYNVKATFFVVNTGYTDILSRMAAEGHSIGIHSATHDYDKIYDSEDAFFADLYQMQDIIAAKAGVTTTLMRFPGGSSNTVSSFNPGIMTRLTEEVERRGFQYFDWNVSSGDAGEVYTADEVFANVVQGCCGRSISVVLQHDSKDFSVDAVEKIIQWGLDNGFTFAPLTPGSYGSHHGVNN